MKQKDLVSLLAITLVVVIAWVGLNFYNNYTQTTISDTQNLQITPINPTFDIETITTLKTRERISPIYDIDQTAINQTTGQSPTATPTPQTGTAESTPEPTTAPATPSVPPADPTPESEE